MIQLSVGKPLEYFLLLPLFQIQAMAADNRHNDDQHSDLKSNKFNTIKIIILKTYELQHYPKHYKHHLID